MDHPILRHFDDIQISNTTKYYQKRLAQAMENGVKGVSQSLIYNGHITDQEHQTITETADRGNEAESSKIVLNLVMQKGALAQRTMWESFAIMRNAVPKLDRILKEVEEHGPMLPSIAAITEVIQKVPDHLIVVQIEHKEFIRELSEKLELKTILTSEKIEIAQLGDRYTELTFISPLRQWKLVEHELLSRGKEHEECREQHLQRELEKIQIGQLFRSSFTREMRLMERSTGDAVVLNKGCSAVACGVPGIGKTTLVQKIIHDWATGTIYPYFQFVFSFKFRDLNSISSKVTLKDLIINSYPHLETILEELWKNPTVLLFIFDGFDEFNGFIDFTDRGEVTKPKHICYDPECLCEVPDIVYSLIQRKLLPGCSVLLTTRPASLNLLEQANINVWVEILGFVGEQRKEYFNRFFGDGAVAEAVFKYVKENEILYTMSYNPSYCCILGLTLGPFFMHKGRDLKLIPKTITQLYSHYVYNTLKKHSSETKNVGDVLLRLGQMARTGVSEKKIVFRKEDLTKHNLQPSQVLSGFLVERLEKVTTGTRVVYTFPHLTIQEFVAALALFLCPYPEDIKKLLTEAHSEKDGRFEVFLRFVAGLSSPGSSKPLMEFVDQFPEESIHQVIDWVKENVDNQIGSSWSERGKRNLLNTLHYLFESQNPAVAQVTLGSVPRLTFGDADAKKALSLTPIDCAVLSHAIRLCHTINELDLRNCCIQYEGMLRLEAELHKCQVLRLEGNNLGDSGIKILSKILTDSKSKTQTVGLADNNLTHCCAEDLVLLTTATSPLKELELGYNKLGDCGVKRLAAALGRRECKLQKLRLNKNDLTSACAEDLARALCTNRSLTEVDLGDNELGDIGVELVFAALVETDCAIQKLCLKNNGFTCSPAEKLATVLRRSHSLKELDLGHNKLGDRGMKRLTTALSDSDCQIQELKVEDNGLTASCAEDLAAALCATPSLTKLELGENYLGDSGVKVLSTALMDPDCKIQKLSLNNNQLTASSARDIASTLNANISLTQLDLGENTLGDSGVKMLSVAIRDSDCNIQELCLRSNGLTASCAKDLASALSSLTKLSLGDNKLGDAGVGQLSEALKDTECNLQKLRLNNNGLTQSCTEGLAAAITTNDSLTGLYLNDNKLGDSGMKALNAALVNPECKIKNLGLGHIGLTDPVRDEFVSTLSAARVMKVVSLETNLSSDQSGTSFCTSNEQKSGMDAMGLSSDLQLNV